MRSNNLQSHNIGNNVGLTPAKPRMQNAKWLMFPLIATTTCFSQVADVRAPGPTLPPPAQPGAGLINDWLRNESPVFTNWDFGGQFRARFEHREHFAIPGKTNSIDFRETGADTDNTYWLLRGKVHLGYAPCEWFSAFVEGRDSSSYHDERNPDPESDSFDLHQAYLTLGNANAFPLTAKVGRQELSYGDERLVGAYDWNNVGRVFDAAKLRYGNNGVWADAFLSRVVLPNDNNFNVANDYDWFYGVYGSAKNLVPKFIVDLYFLGRNTSKESPQAIGAGLNSFQRGATQRDIYTFGLRFKSLPGSLRGWDYEGELAGQFGDFAFATAGPRLEHEAFAAHVAGGYTWQEAWGSPRAGLEYNYASGDSDPNDNKHGTFENLFPTNHRFYGYMDFVSWQNIHNLRASASLKPHSQITLTADYHAFWLADTRDYFYQANGAPRLGAAPGSGTGYGINPAYSNYLGSEVDLVATYSPKPFASAQVGYGHFFVGDYVKSSLHAPGVGAADADFIYVQALLNF